MNAPLTSRQSSLFEPKTEQYSMAPWAIQYSMTVPTAALPAGRTRTPSLLNDTQQLFDALRQPARAELVRYAGKLKAVQTEALVGSAQFYEDDAGQRYVRVSFYSTLGGYYRLELMEKIHRYANMECPTLQYIDTSRDWMRHHTLWFRQDDAGQYEAFVQYQDAYRDAFSVNLTQPLLSFVLPL